ncbi:hypothetical protein GCM10020218_018220 [Dactylosporangium vinaceum]
MHTFSACVLVFWVGFPPSTPPCRTYATNDVRGFECVRAPEPSIHATLRHHLSRQVGFVTDTVPALIPGAGARPLLRQAPLAARPRVLPMPASPPRRSRSTVYGFAAVDKAGRIASRAIFGALG